MFERNLGSVTIDGLKGDGLFTGKLEPDIRKRAVFPAIRAGRVDFYHKGGELVSYAKEFRTHKKYASVIESDRKLRVQQVAHPTTTAKVNAIFAKIKMVRNIAPYLTACATSCTPYKGEASFMLLLGFFSFPVACRVRFAGGLL